ncbi:nucleotidyltransferase domain-containing protein [Cyanobium sp. FGCU-52]|nr:nucleotidyltransferase domain-containing protein [Cyanobium sp. FGCU52]
MELQPDATAAGSALTGRPRQPHNRSGRLAARLLLAAFSGLTTPAWADDTAPQPPEPASPPPETVGPAPPPPDETFWNRATFSGDAWGARSFLAENGVNFRLWATGSYQGQWAGDSGTTTPTDGPGTPFLSGGRLDALIDLDTTRLGLWRGGGFHAHLELEGCQVPGFRGGALWPVNTGAILPLAAPEQLEAASLYYSQRWGGTSLLLGKINVIDLLAADPFFGGWGTPRTNVGIPDPQWLGPVKMKARLMKRIHTPIMSSSIAANPAPLVTREALRSFTEHLVELFAPEKVILFGSMARGEARWDSDADILVVMPHEGRPLAKIREIRKACRPGFPLDLLIWRPEDIEPRYR